MHLLIVLNPSLCIALLIVNDMCYINFCAYNHLCFKLFFLFNIYMCIVHSHLIGIVCVVAVSVNWKRMTLKQTPCASTRGNKSSF